jgi:DNA repair exonuclease SbcCD ATPase subunit
MLTEDGQELLEDLSSESASNGIADRLQRLEEQVDGLRQENQELREENQELKELVKGSDIEMVTGRVQELTDDVDRLQGKVSNLQDALGEINGDPLVGNDLAQVNLNTAFILGNALRELMVEEWGEDRVMDMVGEKKRKFEESDDLI